MNDVLRIEAGEDGSITIHLPQDVSISVPELTPLGIRESDERFHTYSQDSHVGFTDGNRSIDNFVDFPLQMQATTLENAFLALRHKPAPSFFESLESGAAVNNGDVSGVLVFGDVVHYVFPEHRIVINVTVPGHLLHPGIVVNYVHEEDGQIYIVREGVGIGDFGDVNETFGEALWDVQDTDIQNLLNIYGRTPIPEDFDSDIDESGHDWREGRRRGGRGGDELEPARYGSTGPLRHRGPQYAGPDDRIGEDLETTEARVATVVRAGAGGYKPVSAGFSGGVISGLAASWPSAARRRVRPGEDGRHVFDAGSGGTRGGFGAEGTSIGDRPGLSGALEALSMQAGEAGSLMEPPSDLPHRAGKNQVVYRVPSSEIVYLRDLQGLRGASGVGRNAPGHEGLGKISRGAPQAGLNVEKPADEHREGAAPAADPGVGDVSQGPDPDRGAERQGTAAMTGGHHAGKTASTALKRSAQTQPAS
ncbi:MAG: hypothetical protein H6842_15335 [Rhodospirillaceae bacterium]|nr:hypothetical protein [Rhodospirillaceae bacterium]